MGIIVKYLPVINTVSTYHIHIKGLVQGVGFRPYVFQLASRHMINGWVNNSNSGVHIVFNATIEQANLFYKAVIANAPVLSRIVEHSIRRSHHQVFTTFSIVDSVQGPVEKLMMAPDYAMCDECEQDLKDSTNTRYQYPFITCTNCGPRYSILRKLPYDRASTSMQEFIMCSNCQQEYIDPFNRRHYSQTNSCSVCGISLKSFFNTGEQMHGDSKFMIHSAMEALRHQQIVAVKGIGGYLLLADATQDAAVKKLRERKYRPTKPFALLFPSLSMIHQVFDVSLQEELALKSPAAPIVLLEKKHSSSSADGPATDLVSGTIAPGLSQLGVMLPYAPVLYLISTAFGKPLVATSANVSDSPIIFDDREAMDRLKDVADIIITNNRDIVTPQDDSVVKFSKIGMQKVVMRRSRGMAPSYFGYEARDKRTLCATGSLLKSSFTCTNDGDIYISQYLGNTDGYDAQLAYQYAVRHFLHLLQKQPQVVIADKHPQYFTSQFAVTLSEEYQCPLVQVQHHKAHASAVLAENGLLNHALPVLVVVWDGTGLGDDGNIWGGEFFVYEKNAFQRQFYFDGFPVILGDKMAKEPRLSALSVCNYLSTASDLLRAKFSEAEWNLYQKLLSKGDMMKTCSVGRIFDAVASLLGLCDQQTYEGEGALLLETLARTYFSVNGYRFSTSYFLEKEVSHGVPTAKLFSGILDDLNEGKSPGFIAAKFHYSLAMIVIMLAEQLSIKELAFSGGVFQNTVLVDLMQYHFGQMVELYFHQSLSPNDENISFGQMVYFDNDIDGCLSSAIGKDSEAACIERV